MTNRVKEDKDPRVDGNDVENVFHEMSKIDNRVKFPIQKGDSPPKRFESKVNALKEVKDPKEEVSDPSKYEE